MAVPYHGRSNAANKEVYSHIYIYPTLFFVCKSQGGLTVYNLIKGISYIYIYMERLTIITPQNLEKNNVKKFQVYINHGAKSQRRL